MALCLAVLAGFLFWARQALPGLPAVWWGLALFFACRAGQSLPRALYVLRRGAPATVSTGSSGSSAGEVAVQPA